MSSQPRKVVRQFAAWMETKLAENDHKGGWDSEPISWLLERTQQELDELKAVVKDRVLRGPDRQRSIAREAADVANFCMMVADAVGALGLSPNAAELDDLEQRLKAENAELRARLEAMEREQDLGVAASQFCERRALDDAWNLRLLLAELLNHDERRYGHWTSSMQRRVRLAIAPCDCGGWPECPKCIPELQRVAAAYRASHAAPVAELATGDTQPAATAAARCCPFHAGGGSVVLICMNRPGEGLLNR